MSYISATKKDEKVLVWTKDDDGNRVLVKHAVPYYFYVPHKKGTYKSLDGETVKLFNFDTKWEFYDAKNLANSKNLKVYESDIPPELKILSNEYYGKPAPNLNVTFYDIEVDYKQHSYSNEYVVDIRLSTNPDQISSKSLGTIRELDDISELEIWESKIEKWVPAIESSYMYNGPTGFSSTTEPYAPINAIAMMHEHENKMIVIAVPPKHGKGNIPKTGKASKAYINKMNKIAPLIDGVDIEIVFVKNEKKLLEMVLDEIENSDVICGWNNSGFDDPMLGKRIEIVLGKRSLRRMCFPDAPPPVYRDVEMYGKLQPVIDLFGRVSLDYLVLFKKYMVENQPSYKLSEISDKFLRTDGESDMPKLEYDGSLAGLYTEDFDYFIRYNIRDTEILHGFENKFKYVALANQMVHSSTGQFSHVAGTTKLAELSVINFCHYERDKMVVPDKSDDEWADGKIQGAIVLDPVMGIHEWVSSIDLASLYPSVLRACNISPETKIGQFELAEAAFEAIRDRLDSDVDLVLLDGTVETATARQWSKILKDRNHCISGFGTVFTLDQKGIIPSILEDWYTTRKVHQKKMIDSKNAALAILEKYK